MICARCHRPIKHPVNVAGMLLGATCARIAFGAKPKRVAVHRRPDERQVEIPFEVRA